PRLGTALGGRRRRARQRLLRRRQPQQAVGGARPQAAPGTGGLRAAARGSGRAGGELPARGMAQAGLPQRTLHAAVSTPGAMHGDQLRHRGRGGGPAGLRLGAAGGVRPDVAHRLRGRRAGARGSRHHRRPLGALRPFGGARRLAPAGCDRPRGPGRGLDGGRGRRLPLLRRAIVARRRPPARAARLGPSQPRSLPGVPRRGRLVRGRRRQPGPLAPLLRRRRTAGPRGRSPVPRRRSKGAEPRGARRPSRRSLRFPAGRPLGRRDAAPPRARGSARHRRRGRRKGAAPRPGGGPTRRRLRRPAHPRRPLPLRRPKDRARRAGPRPRRAHRGGAAGGGDLSDAGSDIGYNQSNFSVAATLEPRKAKPLMSFLFLFFRMTRVLSFTAVLLLAGCRLAAPIAPAAAAGQIQLSENDRILVLAPHPDDEVLGAGGVLREAAERGIPVRVVFLTSGDSNEWSFLAYRKRPVVLPRAALAMGTIRQREAVVAAEALGVAAEDLTFLGYPDHGTLGIWRFHWGSQPPDRGRLTRARAVPYPAAFRPGAPFKGEEILADLETVLREFRPTRIFVSHPADHHPDHAALYLFTRVALWDLAGEVSATVHPFLVHYPHWPRGKGFRPAEDLAPPSRLLAGFTWQTRELSGEEIAAK